jgi:DNA-binding transcriptional MerR regulator
MAKKTFQHASTVSEYVSTLVRKRALAVVNEHDALISKSYDQIAAGIKRDLKATGYSVKQIKEILEKNFGATKAERVRVIEDAIKNAAHTARTIDRETFDAVYGTGEVDASSRPLDRRLRRAKTLSLRHPSKSEVAIRSTV